MTGATPAVHAWTVEPPPPGAAPTGRSTASAGGVLSRGDTSPDTGLDEAQHRVQHRIQYERFLAAIDSDHVRGALLERTGLGTDAAIEVLDAKLEPGRPAVVLYRVGENLVHGTVPVPDAGPERGPALLLSTYPVDPGLPGLPCVESPECLAASIERGYLDGRVAVRRVRTRLLRYRPGRRATFEVTARIGDDGGERDVRLVAKVYHDAAKAAAAAVEGRELGGQDPRGPLVLARVRAYDADRFIVVQEHLPGRPLEIDLDDTPTPATRRRLESAAAALAAFHGLSVHGGRVRSLDRELARFVSRSAGARSVDPQRGQALLELARRLLALPKPQATVSLVHGDCKPSQFLLHGADVALLDLDHCGLADPAYDVGNVLASLRQQAVRPTMPAGPTEPAGPSGRTDDDRLRTALDLGRAFLGAYTAARTSLGPGAVPDHRVGSRVDFYVAVSLMRKALRAFARDPHSPTPLRLVAEAHRGLDHPGGDFS